MAVLWKNTCDTYYRDIQMKVYEITKLTAELKSSDRPNLRYRNKI